MMNSKRILIEILLVMALTLGGMLFVPQAKTLFALLPIAYLLIEKHLRKRTWEELGFRFRTLWQDLRTTWLWFVLAGLVSQPATIFWAQAYFPEYIRHVQARLPFNDGMSWAVLLPVLAVSVLLEELTYRALFQGRLSPFIGIAAAIVVASCVFGLAHYAAGPAAILAADLGLVFVDSLLYGVIYARGNNVIVAWGAHLLGDILGLALLAYLF